MTEPESSEGRDGQEQQKWHERTRSQVLLFAVGIVLFILVVGFILDWYIDPQKATQRKDLAQALGLITAGVAGAVGIFFTWRGQRLTRESQQENQKNTLEQLKQAREELEINRRGQITERFTAAIDQLGSTNGDGTKNMEVRLGGIYSLERTAREDRDYHWPIMEVLTTYVRKHAAPNPAEEKEEEDPPPMEPDVQAILTVIGRRSIYHKDVEYGPIDLRGADLRRADLQGANLQEANLRGANLRRARFYRANLMKAQLWEADLSGTDVSDADLSRTALVRAQLSGASFRGTALRGSALWHSDLSRASFWNADLSKASFEQANLSGASFYNADLHGANLSEAQGLDQDQLQDANGDASTQLPAHLRVPEHWS